MNAQRLPETLSLTSPHKIRQCFTVEIKFGRAKANPLGRLPAKRLQMPQCLEFSPAACVTLSRKHLSFLSGKRNQTYVWKTRGSGGLSGSFALHFYCREQVTPKPQNFPIFIINKRAVLYTANPIKNWENCELRVSTESRWSHEKSFKRALKFSYILHRNIGAVALTERHTLTGLTLGPWPHPDLHREISCCLTWDACPKLFPRMTFSRPWGFSWRGIETRSSKVVDPAVYCPGLTELSLKPTLTDNA